MPVTIGALGVAAAENVAFRVGPVPEGQDDRSAYWIIFAFTVQISHKLCTVTQDVGVHSLCERWGWMGVGGGGW